MTRDEETLLIRKLQEADLALLSAHVTLMARIPLKDDMTRNEYTVTEGDDVGYLHITYHNGDCSLYGAEMNVNFPSMIGLNRSPLELQILAKHVLSLLP